MCAIQNLCLWGFSNYHSTPFLAGGIYKLMKGAENNTVGSQLGKPNTRKKGPLVSY